ncbi:MAG TPA: glycosyl hydrolase family 28-related protein [Pyrinomonadaceae bacterium]|nr:glycosyl hydrolase family 28-related protein [Pyrinomonadaceae bacterium]
MPLAKRTFIAALALAIVLTQTTISLPTGTKPSGVRMAPCTYSSLWGAAGAQWTPAGRLPDFSYAGYDAGQANIPSPPAKWDLKRDFHAAGDGKTDDTAALSKAIESINTGVLFIPRGTYVIAKRIDITKGNLVLRGAGPNETILSFPNSLQDLFGNKAKGTEQSQWSFRPGLINVTGKDRIDASTRLATVTGAAKRWSRILTISTAPANRAAASARLSPASVRKGQWIRLVESDPPKTSAATGSLIRYLYGDLTPPVPGSIDNLIGTPSVVRFLSRVKRVSGNQVELERPLPYDVRLEWAPELHTFSPSVQEVGIEHLSIHFPWSAYPGHFKEKGYNALFFEDVAQCWINDVEIQNSDFAIDLNSTNFCTVSNVRLTTSANRAVVPEARGANGHHGIDVSHGTENLVTGFDVQTKLVHDISVEWYALHTVFSRGRGVDLNMDHHREANYSSLFSQLDVGAGSRPFDSGGSSNRGPHAGAYNTYWNIRAASSLKLPAAAFGPLLNFIGVAATGTTPDSPYQWMVEQIHPGSLCPGDLHQAMKARRLHKRESGNSF